MLAGIFIIVAMVIGAVLAFTKAQLLTRVVVFVAIFLFSNYLLCRPYFTSEPRTWIETYISGLFETGIASFLLHVAPAIVVFHVVVFFLQRK